MANRRKSFLMRVDPRVHAALERWARDELRSVNAQVEYLLREALHRAGRLEGPEDQKVEEDPKRPSPQ